MTMPRQPSRRCLFALLALALALSPSPAAAQDRALRDVVADVKIIGNKKTPIETILRYIHTRPGMDFNASTLTDDIGRLSSSRLFKRIPEAQFESSPRGVIVTFLVVEYPNRVQEVVFKGANHVSKKDLESATRIRKGMPLDPASNKSACMDLQNLLKKKGRHFANVTLEEGDKETDTRVVFNVSEGPIVRVRSISFEGNETFTSRVVKTHYDTSKGFALTFGGKFCPDMVNNDIVKLEEYYQNNGYRNVKVNREMIFSPDFQWVDIAFHVHEGQRYRIEGSTVEGVSKNPDDKNRPSHDQVSSIIQLKREYYNEGASNGTRNITNLYSWRGYEPNVNMDVFTVPDKPGVVRVQYDVKERPQRRVAGFWLMSLVEGDLPTPPSFDKRRSSCLPR